MPTGPNLRRSNREAPPVPLSLARCGGDERDDKTEDCGDPDPSWGNPPRETVCKFAFLRYPPVCKVRCRDPKTLKEISEVRRVVVSGPTEKQGGHPRNDGVAGSGLRAVLVKLSRAPSGKEAILLVHFWDNPSTWTTMHR